MELTSSRTYGPFVPMVPGEHIAGTVRRETGAFVFERETIVHDGGTVTVQCRIYDKS